MFDFINKHRRISVAAVCSLATAALLMIILIYNGFAPFGNRTFATADAYIQYIDFFSYFNGYFIVKIYFIEV